MLLSDTMETQENATQDTCGSAEKIHKLHYSEDSEMWGVNNSPLTINRNKNDWFVGMGKNRLSELYKSKEEALIDAKMVTPARVVQICSILMQDNNLKKVLNEN